MTVSSGGGPRAGPASQPTTDRPTNRPPIGRVGAIAPRNIAPPHYPRAAISPRPSLFFPPRPQSPDHSAPPPPSPCGPVAGAALKNEPGHYFCAPPLRSSCTTDRSSLPLSLLPSFSLILSPFPLPSAPTSFPPAQLAMCRISECAKMKRARKRHIAREEEREDESRRVADGGRSLGVDERSRLEGEEKKNYISPVHVCAYVCLSFVRSFARSFRLGYGYARVWIYRESQGAIFNSIC